MFLTVLPQLRRELSDTPIHVVWVEHTYLFPEARVLLGLFPGADLAADSHNVEHELHRRCRRLLRSVLARCWYSLQAWAIRREETRGYSACRFIACCSEDDAHLIRVLAPAAPAAFVTPNGVDTAFYAPGRTEDAEPSVLYTGGFGYLPNQDAVRFFHQAVWPKVRSQVPACRFRIVGSQAREYFGGMLALDPAVEVASDVPDMRPYFDRAWVVVVPLRAGSGTRFKILEAMAMAKPVVSTNLGAEGIPAADGEQIVLADDPDAFARAVVLLLRDAQRRRALGLAARRLACERYHWAGLCDRMAAAFHHQFAPGAQPASRHSGPCAAETQRAD